MQLLALFFADPSAMPHLGRFDPLMMDDQTRMELLLGDRKMSTGSRRLFKKPDGEFRDIKQWGYVKFDDENDAIIEVNWSCSGMHGGLETQYMPSTLRKFVIDNNRLKGTVNWHTLPAELEHFSVEWNQLSGSVDFSNLPENLAVLLIGFNKFRGSVDLSGITKSIRKLDLSGNRFIGELDLNLLPEEAQVNRDSGFSPIKGYRDRIKRN